MTAKEMTEIFGVMLLAWPNAETFRGGLAKLGPTVKLWTDTTRDIDFWTGQRAVLRLCMESKYPPTIAEFRAAAETVERDIKRAIKRSWQTLTIAAAARNGDVTDFLQRLPRETPVRAVVTAMGGPDALIVRDEAGRRWNYKGFEAAYIALIRQDPAFDGGVTLALPGRRKECT